MAIRTHDLFVLCLACSFMVATFAQSDTLCCEDYSSYSYYPGGTSSNTLNYRQYTDGTKSTDGTINFGYKSPCGSCASASYTLKAKSCKYDGSLPTIRSFKCTYALTYLSSSFVDKKNTRNSQPCYFYSDVSKPVNDTHYEQCTATYIGVAASEFSLKAPSSVATVNCQGLVATAPKSCNIFSNFYPFDDNSTSSSP